MPIQLIIGKPFIGHILEIFHRMPNTNCLTNHSKVFHIMS